MFAPARSRIEWPTVAVGGAVYTAWLGLVLAWTALPPAVAVPAGGVLLAWHGSFQHEAIHGHPFRDRRRGDWVAAAPLSLWLPYPVYRASHLAHHRTGRLTDPFDDPESWYVSARRWAGMGRLRRGTLAVNGTLAGRLVIGPALLVARSWRAEAARVATGAPGARRIWAGHWVAVAVVLAVLAGQGVPWWQYGLACYLGVSLTLLRSFAEHRAVPDAATPNAVVAAGSLLGLLFLNNNLHHTHHARPGAPWYRLPALARTLGSADAAAVGAGHYRSYTDVVRRFLVRPLDGTVHRDAVVDD